MSDYKDPLQKKYLKQNPTQEDDNITVKIRWTNEALKLMHENPDMGGELKFLVKPEEGKATFKQTASTFIPQSLLRAGDTYVITVDDWKTKVAVEANGQVEALKNALELERENTLETMKVLLEVSKESGLVDRIRDWVEAKRRRAVANHGLYHEKTLAYGEILAVIHGLISGKIPSEQNPLGPDLPDRIEISD